ncbi:MAG: hypothetical protein OCD76_02815 [Reichenbachiella sp.]
MNLKNHFNIKRFWLLLKLEYYRSKKGLTMTLGITFGMLFFIGFLLTMAVEPSVIFYEHNQNYAFTLLIGGFVLSSLAFSDLGNGLKRSNYLMLPASTFERFLSMWLLTSFGWVIAYSIEFYFYTLIANNIGHFIFPYVEFQSFDPFGSFPTTIIHYYLVLQGIFLIGAVHFRGYVLPKTLMTLILAAFSCGLIAYFMIHNIMNEDSEECLTQTEIFEGSPVDYFWKWTVAAFWWLLAPITWIITYFGLKEQEV